MATKTKTSAKKANSKKTFYVTTAIDYVNAEPHIGHAYQKIVADVLTRWNSLVLGKENVLFVTGTDEHGKKVAQSAEENKLKPKDFVDKISEKFKEAWRLLNIDYNRFIRTTDKDHEKTVKEFVDKINKKGDIYKSNYSGLYCVSCEAYYTEKDLINGQCPYHPNKKIELLEEETYFFRLSKYQNFLLNLYKEHPEFVLPKERRNEVINRVKEGLKDLSITRTSIDWGIPFPLDKKHVIYVWFEALINYYTATNNKERKKFWPADIHLLGKDNGWFHAVIWPAILKSAGFNLPKTVFIHGFLTFNGQKISKSLGNSISIPLLVEKYGSETIRYFVCRQFPFAEGEDGDFSESALINRHNNELANKLGNLISRVSALAEMYGIEAVKENKLLQYLKLKEIEKLMQNFELDKALNLIFEFIDKCNEYIQSNKIWESKDKKQLYELVDSIKAIAILLWPFIPATSEKIAKHFSFNRSLNEINKPYKVQKIKKSEILFNKIEEKKEDKPKKREIIKKDNKIQGVIKMNEIKFNEWQNIELRVGKVLKVEDIEGADKLYKLSVDLGKELGKRTIAAGIKQAYKKTELENNKFIFLANLESKNLRGVDSHGMILAAVQKDDKGKEKIVLLKPEKDVDVGTKIF